MRKSKKIFVIGRKPTKFKLALTTIICIIFSVIFGGFLNNIFDIKGAESFISIIIIFVLFELLYIPTAAVCTKHWDISDEYLEYYFITNYFEQLKYSLSVLSGNEERFACKIKLDQIEKIRIFWTTELCVYSSVAHSIYFGVTLKDGSIIKFRASVVTSSTDEYVDALQYLKDKFDIVIEDEYGLLNVLRDKNINVVDYIDNIEKQSKGNGA